MPKGKGYRKSSGNKKRTFKKPSNPRTALRVSQNKKASRVHYLAGTVL